MQKRYNWEDEFESCVYSDRLLDKLIAINRKSSTKIDILEIKKAIFYAKKYHGNQKRQSGEPYYSHPLEVANMISDYLFRTDIIVTSILHDTIEDTDLTFDMIESAFGKIIACQVEDLTRVKKDGRKISASETVESLWLQKKYDILLIKQFDRLHNMQTIEAKSPEKRFKIIKETLEDFLIVAIYLEIPEIKKDLIELCYKNLFTVQQPQNNLYLTPFQDSYQPLSPVFQNDLIHKQIQCLLEALSLSHQNAQNTQLNKQDQTK